MKVSHDSVFMKTTLLVLTGMLLTSCGGTAPENPAATSQGETSQPSIEGTYRLVSRELADGTKFQAPDVMGLFTYTKTQRNFNIAARDEKGPTFNAHTAEYRLTPTDYSETSVLTVASDDTDRDRFKVMRTESTKSVPVKVEGDRIELQPQGEPVLVFEGTKLTATMEGEFVDVWEKVE